MDVTRAGDIVTELMVRYSFQVLAALAIFGAGVLCARIVGRFVERWIARTALELHLQRLVVRACKVLVLLFTVVLALDKFGVQVTALELQGAARRRLETEHELGRGGLAATGLAHQPERLARRDGEGDAVHRADHLLGLVEQSPPRCFG